MKDNKLKSILVIIPIYVIAFLGAVLSYIYIPFEFVLLKFLVADVIATIIIYIGSVIFKNASVYDPYWSVSPMIMIIAFLLISNTINLYTIIMVVIVELWGFRLTLNCFKRFKNLNIQDWRYDMYKNKYPKIWQLINFFGIHLMPTLVVFIGMLPAFAYIEAFKTVKELNLTLIFAIAISILAIVIETIADIQTDIFRKKPENIGKINRTGLWKISRHPNYFGEILFWFSLFLMYLSVDGSLWVLLFSPLVVFLLFAIVSIPMMEKRQLENKPDYAEYKKETNMLLPIFAPTNDEK